MRYKTVLFVGIIITIVIECAALLMFYVSDTESLQSVPEVNEAVHTVEKDFSDIKNHINKTSLDYSVLDTNGKLIYKTKNGLSESVNSAIAHRDTVIDIEINNETAGKLIIYNPSAEQLQAQKTKLLQIFFILVIIQLAGCLSYVLYLNRAVIKPFEKLKSFALRVAGGNLDIPLEMDRHNIFGAFTESFDIMRSELKSARAAEARANASKKELVAKLSHDIRTPVASIKAAAEVGKALSSSDKLADNYAQIIIKADQINTLVTNLFTATLEELEQLSVNPADMSSTELSLLLKNADYLHRAELPKIPECLVFADKLRLQQVFDNVFSNSYKYADTDIDVSASKSNGFLNVEIRDFGKGVNDKELAVLKEKFRRGNNAKDTDGAGLGLYISNSFMEQMGGALSISNADKGLRVKISIKLS